MGWKSKAEAGALFALIVMGSFALAVIAHEGYHLALSTEPHGVCFGWCEAQGKHDIAIAWAIHNDWSRNEYIATAIGWTVFGISSIFGCIALARLYFAKTRK